MRLPGFGWAALAGPRGYCRTASHGHPGRWETSLCALAAVSVMSLAVSGVLCGACIRIEARGIGDAERRVAALPSGRETRVVVGDLGGLLWQSFTARQQAIVVITRISLIVSKVAFLVWSIGLYLWCAGQSEDTGRSRLTRIGLMAIVYVVPLLNLYYPTCFLRSIARKCRKCRVGLESALTPGVWKWSFIAVVLFAVVESVHGVIVFDLHASVPASSVLTFLKINLLHFLFHGWLSAISLLLIAEAPRMMRGRIRRPAMTQGRAEGRT